MQSLKRQVSIIERQSAEDLRTICDGLLINGVDTHAVWRTHLRAQTTARQALEQHARSRAGDTEEETEEREASQRAGVLQLAEQHLAWVQAHQPQSEPYLESETWVAAEANQPRTTRARSQQHLWRRSFWGIGQV